MSALAASLPFSAFLAPVVTLGAETADEVVAREALLDRAMGPMRRRKASEAIRRGRLPSEGLALSARAEDGSLLGTVRLWDVAAGDGGTPSLLLGPLAVEPTLNGAGIGSALMRRAIAEAQWRGHRSILLVGDPAYYERFGFSAVPAAGLAMPGPFERHRMLGLELAKDSLRGAQGLIRPTGRRAASERRVRVSAAPASVASF